MSHEHDKTVAPAANDYAQQQHVHYKGAGNDQALLDDPQQAFKTIETFANGGKGDPAQIVHIARALTFELRQQVGPLMKPLAKRLSGDQLVQLGAIADVDLGFTVQLALHAKPALGADHLRRYLRGLDPGAVAAIADDDKVFAEIRKVLSGPLTTELPVFADAPKEMHGKPRLVEWYLATTDKTVAALALEFHGSAALAKTLDGLGAWSWLDNLHVARSAFLGTGLEMLRDNTSNAAAKAKIQQMLGSFKPSEHVPMGPDGNAARAEIDANLASGGDTNALLDASARAGFVDAKTSGAVDTRLAGESASAVLEFALATLMDPMRAVPLLVDARGVTSQQLGLLLGRADLESRVRLLSNDRLRAKIRKVLGASTPLVELFPTADDREAVHAKLYADEALRQWAYKDKSPETALWIAAGSNHASEACKLVKREIGYEWVKSLPPTASSVELRRFALGCGDDKMVSYVHEHLLGDRTAKVDPTDNQVGSLPGDVYGARADLRLQQEVSKKPDAARPENVPDPKAVIARLGDLNADQRAAVLKNPGELRQLFDGLADADSLRAVFLLGPTLPQLLALPLHDGESLLHYVVTRPASEQNACVENASLVAKAKALFKHIEPHVVFPVLRAAPELARALKASPLLLEWMLEQSDPSFVMTALSEEPVRSVAASLFEQEPTIYDKLPAYKHLLPRGRQGFDSIAKGSKDEDAQSTAKDYQSGTPTPDAKADVHAERVEQASAQGHLWFAIETLQQKHGTSDSAMALIQNAPPAERIALLGGQHTTSVEKLRAMTPMSPVHVFPGLSTQQLLALPDAADWMLEVEPSYAILSRVTGPAIKGLAHVLESDVARAIGWIDGLPDSAGLTRQEMTSLDGLAGSMSNEVLLRALFQKRYGAPAEDTFHAEELKKMWTVLARLPPSQVNQHVIADFNHGSIGEEVAGMWYSPHLVLSDDPKKLAGNEASYEDSDLLTAAQMKGYYGLEGHDLEVASGEHGWIAKESGRYRVKEVNTTPQFEATVLHEVGHSVDTMLGEHTDLIYNVAGWQQFGVDQFDEWATQMGALTGVKGAEREKVINAWKESLRAKKGVSEMVAPDHPAMTLPKDDPLAQEAAAGGRFEYKHARHTAHGDHVFMANGPMLYSVKQSAAHQAPSEYAMSAPAEYFAECYVEYYRGYKGTPDTAAAKGGHLPPAFKKWFDTHVDNVRLAPDRISGGKDAKPDAPNKKSKQA